MGIRYERRSVGTGDTTIANGKGLVVGHTAQIAAGALTSEVQVLGTTEADGSAVIYVASTTDTLAPKLKMVKGAHGTIGTFSTTVVDDEILGAVEFYGTDGTDADTLAALMQVEVDDGSPEAGGIGSAFVFKTMPGGGTTAAAERLRIDAAGVVTIAGGLTVSGTDVLKGAAKGWISFNGTSTIAINASHNVDGISDGGTGTYIVTWTTAFSSSDYAATAWCASAFHIFEGYAAAPTAGAIQVRTTTVATNNVVDCSRIYVSAHGDQ